MQVYRELRVLTARPTPEEEARVPHALYGVRPAGQPGSVVWWRGEALAAMRDYPKPEGWPRDMRQVCEVRTGTAQNAKVAIRDAESVQRG